MITGYIKVKIYIKGHSETHAIPLKVNVPVKSKDEYSNAERKAIGFAMIYKIRGLLHDEYNDETLPYAAKAQFENTDYTLMFTDKGAKRFE